MSFANKVQDIANRAGLKVIVQNDDFVTCGFNLAEGRSQAVHLAPAGDLAGQQVVRISTPVQELPGELPQNLANQLLTMNTQFKIGSFGIIEASGKRMLMFSHNMVLDALEPQELTIVVATLAQSGDQFEKQFGGGDRF